MTSKLIRQYLRDVEELGRRTASALWLESLFGTPVALKARWDQASRKRSAGLSEVNRP